MEILFILIILILLKIKEGQKTQKRKHYPRKQTVENTNYAQAYHAVPLLTDREQREYQKLREYAKEKNVLICPKVRLLDLVTPRPGTSNYKTLLSKVMSKHVDFVICSQDMKVLGIIELDDTTHLRKDRVQRDEFVDTVLKGSGYRIIHTWSIKQEDLDLAIGAPTPEIKIEKIVSPTGWIWNENTKLWEPPEELKSRQ